jgi:hypothetical protein
VTDTDLAVMRGWLQAADADILAGKGNPWIWSYARDVRLLLAEVERLRQVIPAPSQVKTFEELLAEGGIFYDLAGVSWCDTAADSWVLVPGMGYVVANEDGH